MPYNINEAIKKAEAEYGFGKGEYFKAQEGDNRIRLLSAFEGYQSVYQGKPTFKFVAWVLDRKDSKIKPYFMPMTIVDAIGALQANPDYVFDDMPMPYDITINAKGAGTKEVKYTVVAARQNAPLTAEENKALSEKMDIVEFVNKLKERDSNQQPDQSLQTPKSTAQPTPEEDAEFIPDDIPLV